MDKITFLNELELELDELPREEKDKLMDDYENHFYEQESKGKSEKDIISDLKEPHDIGNEVKAKEAISNAKVTPNLRNIIRAIMASLSLGVLSFFLHHHPYCNIYSVIVCCVYILCFFNFSSINNNINEYH